jgi:hypothetical protein
MKIYFSKLVIGSASAEQGATLSPCSGVKIYSASGTVTVTINDGDPMPVSSGDTFHANFPGQFDRVRVTTAAGGSATVLYGNGSFSGSAGAATGGGGVQSTTGSPEGVLDAADGQWAYDGSSGALWINPNTVGTSGWVNLIA